MSSMFLLTMSQIVFAYGTRTHLHNVFDLLDNLSSGGGVALEVVMFEVVAGVVDETEYSFACNNRSIFYLFFSILGTIIIFSFF